MGLGRLRHEGIYQAILESHQKYGYPIRSLCQIGQVTRAAYYKWLNRKTPENEVKNIRLSKTIEVDDATFLVDTVKKTVSIFMMLVLNEHYYIFLTTSQLMIYIPLDWLYYSYRVFHVLENYENSL